MINKNSYFDRIDVVSPAGIAVLKLYDELTDTNYIVEKLDTLSYGGGDFEKWSVFITSNSNTRYEYRKRFDTKTATEEYVNEVKNMLKNIEA
ncbi:hypothetical protein [Sulfuriferula nivalis]|uniref:Uncharacterized protein n=1 Tax=Sulfuriferula nivalis TaxID=2675298 RepID=A0A809REV1_9PROT|nr:hypothetical protein [Sulfuriferula nivalis]BBP00329.1 hypothetical protein SFSGTM_10370 [Sulfuriferula nivalis]